MAKKQFRDDEATDLINTGLERIKRRGEDLHRHLSRTVRKLEEYTTPPPAFPAPQETEHRG